VRLPDKSQPIYLEGYHKPAGTDPDEAVYDAISDLLSNGRTARLYRSLVRDKKIAIQAGAFPGFPGTKYPMKWFFTRFPHPGIPMKRSKKALRDEIDRLKSEPVSDEELKMVKTRAKADLIRSLADTAASPARSPATRPSMAIGANHFARLTGLTKSPRKTSNASPKRHLSPHQPNGRNDRQRGRRRQPERPKGQRRTHQG